MRQINHNAPIKCSNKILIHANPDIVWSVLTNIERWPVWQADISSSKLHGPLEAGTSFVWKSGGAKINSILHTVSPYQQFGWTGKTLGMFAIHNWTLTEKNHSTEVAVEESMEGFLAGLFKKPLNKNLEKGMQTWLDLLKKEAEKQPGTGIRS